MENIRTLADAKETLKLLDELLRYVDELVSRAEQNPELRTNPRLTEFKQRRAAYQSELDALKEELARVEKLEEKWGDDEYTYRPTRLDGGNPRPQG